MRKIVRLAKIWLGVIALAFAGAWLLSHLLALPGGSVLVLWGAVQYTKGNADVLGILTMFGEFGIVAVIYWELETNRLDKFVEIAFSDEHFDARNAIFEAYCGLTPAVGQSRNEAFRDRLASEANIKDGLKRKCDRELALLSRIGSGLPFLLQRRALRWFPHSVVFLWEILGPYVLYRRQSTIPLWAGSFVLFASKCLQEIEREGRSELILVDPDRNRKNDITFTSARLSEMRAELKAAARAA